MSATFPFGRPSTRRPPRVPQNLPAELFVLGVYPSALHVRWRRPDGKVIGAIAVDDEPMVFWDGADADQRIAAWQVDVGWNEKAWGTIGRAGGNGSSGKAVVDGVLAPLGARAEATYFTDCLPYYFVKFGAGSQGTRQAEIYAPFALDHGLAEAELPPRPPATELVRRTVEEESDELRAQLAASGAERAVTLGQEAADVFAAITGSTKVQLTQGLSYPTWKTVTLGGRRIDWLPLIHPGNRDPDWRRTHQSWISAQTDPRIGDLKVTTSWDVDGSEYLVSLDPSKRPENWVVEFRPDSGTTELLDGEKYGDFEGLYYRYPPGNLYAWLPPSASGSLHITAPGGGTAEVRWHGRG